MRTALIAIAAGSVMATTAFASHSFAGQRLDEASKSQAQNPFTQPPADGSSAVSEVVVEAKSKKSLQAFATAVDKFVRSQGKPGPVQQLTRWARPICPQTFGLRQEINDFVSRRIAAAAREVGAETPGTCQGANVLVLFTAQPDVLIADIRDHHPALLGSFIAGDAKALAHFQPPIKSWYASLTTASVHGTKEVTLDKTLGSEQPNCTQMRTCEFGGVEPMKSQFAFVLVVVEANSIVGKPIGAIADEVAMTVLSRSAHTGCSPLPSVMDVLEPACADSAPVEGLTVYDKAFLKALYAPRDTEVLPYDRAMIERKVKAAAQTAAADPEAPAGERVAGDASQN